MSGFSMGFLKGILVSLIGLSAVSLVTPLAPLDPGKSSQVELDTPDGSGFNAARDDTNPVLPDTDQTVVKETIEKPDTSQDTPDIVTTDTRSAEKPPSRDGVEMPDVTPEQDEVAILTPTVDNDVTSTSPARPPALGLPMPTIDNPVREIPVNKLPMVKPPVTELDGLPDVDPQSGDAAKRVVNPVNPDAKRAFDRNKIAFRNPGGKPLMSVILIDVGPDGVDRDQLLTFSFPVTFALDPQAEGVTATDKTYRTNGFETLALTPVDAATSQAAENPADLQGVLNSNLARTPNAIGLLDGVATQLQQTPDLAAQVIAALADSGHALITYDIGLNSTNQKAKSAGLPAGIVFRVLDGDLEKSDKIKRYLDRAVLEAGKDGHVIVLGRTYPDTVTALFSWAVSAKSSTVALAPVSAVLDLEP